MHDYLKLKRAVARATTLALGAAVTATSAWAEGANAKINDHSPAFDVLWNHVIRDISIIGVLFAIVIAYFVIKYKRQSSDQVGTGPFKMSAGSAVGWTVIPIFVFLSIDLYTAANGWVLWNFQREVPADRLEVKLESGMYSWDYTYPNGVRTQNELIVPAGKPILLRMTSRDVLHSHYLPDFRVKEDSMPGRITYLWFYPTKPGEHVVTCAEYCGVMHSYMAGRVIVKSPADYTAWMSQEETKLATGNAPDKAATAEAAVTAAVPNKT